MDKDAFFREATLRICGNLEIEEALQALVILLAGFMPVTSAYLQYYDRNYAAMRTIAQATETDCQKLNLLTPLSEAAKQHAGNAPTEQDVFLIRDPKTFPISREMTEFHHLETTSVIVMVLRTDKETFGYFVLASEKPEKLKYEHLEWVLMLKEPLVIAMSNALKHREVVKFNDLLADHNRYLAGELRRLSGDEIVGADFGLRSVTQKVRQVASLDSPVLLLGETGTGKDVIANAIHYSSQRHNGPFVSVNCGAIPDTLIDSELFGHEKGAFTGALSQKRGRFERANRGTILLDEIGELPPQAQVRLLSVLQDRKIERVGGVKTIPLDIRIIAATNRNLEQMVEEERFREDLWFRLNVFPIWIPPLRERKSDIPTLVQHFIALKSRELKLPHVPTLSSGTMDIMMDYHWPGNVRELQNIIERALILNPSGPLSPEDISIASPHRSENFRRADEATERLDDVISNHIRRALSKTKGKVSGEDGAAALLGINPSTLRNRMKKLGIDYGRSSKD